MPEPLHAALYRLNVILEEAAQDPVIDSGELDSAMVHILDAAARGLAVSRVSIWRFDPEAGVLRCLLLSDASIGLCRDPMELQEADCPLYIEAVRQARVIVAHDTAYERSTLELYESYLLPLGIQSMLDAPIRRTGQVVGVLCAEHQGRQRTWSIAEITFAGVVADLVARAISGQERVMARRDLEASNLALEDRVQERTRELREAMKRLELAREQLVESEKFAALGSLVAGVAHEVNTPVGVAVTALSHLTDGVQTLRDAYEDNSLSRSTLERFLTDADRSGALLQQNLRRASELVRSFKRVAVNQTSEVHTSFSLREELENVLLSLHSETRRRKVDVEVHCDPGLRMISFPGPVAQLVANLVMNSLLHGFEKRDRGKIVLAVDRCGDNVVLTYTDDGCGIPRSDLRRVFEPFYTTRRHAGGTGLGLHIVFNLVNHKLGGKLALRSDVGQGVHYRIELPIEVPADVTDPLIHAA